MDLNKEMCMVIAELEHEIGSECYNPNSYDGWNNIVGREFRYPINVPKDNGEFIKVKNKITQSGYFSEQNITPDTIKYMKYKFGSNELFIGLGLINVLDYLEKRYGLDFNELESRQGK